MTKRAVSCAIQRNERWNLISTACIFPRKMVSYLWEHFRRPTAPFPSRRSALPGRTSPLHLPQNSRLQVAGESCALYRRSVKWIRSRSCRRAISAAPRLRSDTKAGGSAYLPSSRTSRPARSSLKVSRSSIFREFLSPRGKIPASIAFPTAITVNVSPAASHFRMRACLRADTAPSNASAAAIREAGRARKNFLSVSSKIPNTGSF